jgi:hypothetical protein
MKATPARTFLYIAVAFLAISVAKSPHLAWEYAGNAGEASIGFVKAAFRRFSTFIDGATS